jgi:hypothetical protein
MRQWLKVLFAEPDARSGCELVALYIFTRTPFAVRGAILMLMYDDVDDAVLPVGDHKAGNGFLSSTANLLMTAPMIKR